MAWQGTKRAHKTYGLRDRKIIVDISIHSKIAVTEAAYATRMRNHAYYYEENNGDIHARIELLGLLEVKINCRHLVAPAAKAFKGAPACLFSSLKLYGPQQE